MDDFLQLIAGRMLKNWEKETFTAAVTGTTLNLDSLRGIEARMRETINAIADVTALDRPPVTLGHYGGIPVRESPLCIRQVQVRIHKKRRNQSQAYHARINKKWLKRFGTKPEKVAYMVDMDYIGLGGKSLFVHPDHAAMLRNIGA